MVANEIKKEIERYQYFTFKLIGISAVSIHSNPVRAYDLNHIIPVCMSIDNNRNIQTECCSHLISV